jgi:hypothetical protein
MADDDLRYSCFFLLVQRHDERGVGNGNVAFRLCVLGLGFCVVGFEAYGVMIYTVVAMPTGRYGSGELPTRTRERIKAVYLRSFNCIDLNFYLWY